MYEIFIVDSHRLSMPQGIGIQVLPVPLGENRQSKANGGKYVKLK